MPTSTQKEILVVEDDEDISSVLKLYLESEGYTVWLAGNGVIALELIHKRGTPNLILLDMKMPIMNGWQFAIEFIKRYDHQTPIVVMTAAADARQRAKDIGADGWVGKPFELDELMSTIRKYSP